MTHTKSKADWITAWNKEARLLFRAYQCKADSQLYDQLEFAIKAVIVELEEIADRMEKEGVWKTKGSCPMCGEELFFGECPNCYLTPASRGGTKP